MNRETILRLAEGGLLLLAVFFTLPSIPSNEDPISLMPALIFAVIAFGASRAIRWRGHWVIWTLELVGFSGFAWLSNEIANTLLTA